ncbi:MAG: hypothetical protein NC419_07085 [Muribaculaceae bacterium]|nr:hypothetical protein [Muribaculaceae bacterium]
MCLKSNKEQQHALGSNEEILRFYVTRFNVLIPVFISFLVFIVEIYSVYYVAEEPVTYINILRLINTTFIPTHVATTTLLLYQHFSLVNYYNNSRKKKPLSEMDLNAEYVAHTMISTIILAFFYIVFSFKVGFINQVLLLVMQGIYMIILWKYCLKDKIIIYERTIKDVVSL